jgi:aspartate/tyrosine/aromatic aminotransferase
LGVGAYRTEQGKPYVLEVVKKVGGTASHMQGSRLYGSLQYSLHT